MAPRGDLIHMTDRAFVRNLCAQLSIARFATITDPPCRLGMRCQSGSRLADGERGGYSKVVILWTVRRALKLSLSLLDVQGDRKLPSI